MITKWYKWERSPLMWKASVQIEARKILSNENKHEQDLFLFNVLKNADILELEENEQWSTNCEPFYEFLRAIV